MANWKYLIDGEWHDFPESLIGDNWGFVYMIKFPNGKFYVGKRGFRMWNGRTPPKLRWTNWRVYNGSGRYLKGYLAKHSKEWIIANSDRMILNVCATEDEAYEIEEGYIARLKASGRQHYNLSSRGKGMGGHKHTEESKRKMSNALKGMKHTEESKQRMSEGSLRFKGEKLKQLIRLFSEGDYTKKELADYFGLALQHVYFVYKKHCKKAGIQHGRPRQTFKNEQMPQILRLLSEGDYSHAEIAKYFNLKRPTLTGIWFRHRHKRAEQ